MVIRKCCVAFAVCALLAVPAASDTCSNKILKVPCRDKGDGRTLIDSLYLPDGVDVVHLTYKILRTRPTSMQGEWANLVCTIRIK
jgi:hypothetical protein